MVFHLQILSPPNSLSEMQVIRTDLLARASNHFPLSPPIVSPQLRPFSFPQVVDIGENEKLFWPTTTGNKGTVNVQIFDGLVFACRVEGRPKALVKWTLNGSPADTLPYAIVLEPQPGRSVLFIDITNDTEKMLFFMSMNPLNKIECSASNPRGSTSGSIEIVGSCESMLIHCAVV